MEPGDASPRLRTRSSLATDRSSIANNTFRRFEINRLRVNPGAYRSAMPLRSGIRSAGQPLPQLDPRQRFFLTELPKLCLVAARLICGVARLNGAILLAVAVVPCQLVRGDARSGSDERQWLI
jgi:hypothetical protein